MGDLHQLWREQQRAHVGGAVRHLAVHLFTCAVLVVLGLEACRRGDVATAVVTAGAVLLNVAAAGVWLHLGLRARRNRRAR